MDGNQTYSVEKATEKDVALILALRKKMFREMGVPDTALLDDADDVLLALYRDAYRRDEMVHFIAYDENRNPAAVAGALLKRDFPYLLFKPGDYGWIIDVYTEPGRRGKNFAAKLIALTHDWLREKGVREAKLISAGADARRLYRRIGYRPTWEMSFNLAEEPTYNEMMDARGAGPDG
jgi:GNAT superfamily N-acetyltransferase